MSASQYAPLTNAKPMKVLLVEDSVLIRDALMEVLSGDNNLKVDGIAATQSNALALLDTQQFDMLLLDIELAEGNGFEVIRHTQKTGYPFKAPVLIMLTNHANSQYRKLAKDLGVKYFFDKSLDFDLAIETIEREAAMFSNTAH
jgi:DNA-binding NarL/FixJ family response regulator